MEQPLELWHLVLWPSYAKDQFQKEAQTKRVSKMAGAGWDQKNDEANTFMEMLENLFATMRGCRRTVAWWHRTFGHLIPKNQWQAERRRGSESGTRPRKSSY